MGRLRNAHSNPKSTIVIIGKHPAGHCNQYEEQESRACFDLMQKGERL